jgi:hypothetical protein
MNSFARVARWSGVGPVQCATGPVCGPVSVPRGSGAGPEIPPHPHVLRTGCGPAPQIRKAVRSALRRRASPSAPLKHLLPLRKRHDWIDCSPL